MDLLPTLSLDPSTQSPCDAPIKPAEGCRSGGGANQLVMLAGCWHLPEVEAPARVSELIETHLCVGS